jgi:hypothetical protein
MEFFYIGTTSLNYWMKKYLNRIWRPAKDCDIVPLSLSKDELKKKYPTYDVVDIVECSINLPFPFYEKGDDGAYYCTPEYLIMTYYRRLERSNSTSRKHMDDMIKSNFLLQIIEKRNNLESLRNFFKENKYEGRQFFSPNKNIYRVLPTIYYNEILGGEFALMCYYDLLGLSYGRIKNLDLHLFNCKRESTNINGSKIIPHPERIPYINYDGLKIQTLESLSETFPEVNIPDNIKTEISNLNLDILNM